jgi:hypothetical protein
VSETTLKPTRKKKRTLSPRQREKACALWGAGEGTLDSLSAMFDVSRKTLQNLFELRGIKKGDLAEKIRLEAKAELDRMLREQAATLAGQAYETKDELHKLIRYYTKKIGQLGLRVHTEGKSLASIRADIQTAREAIAALKLAQEAQFPLLGIKEDEKDPNAELPDLHIVELSDEEIRLKQAAQAGDLGDTSGEAVAVMKELDKEMKGAGKPE